MKSVAFFFSTGNPFLAFFFPACNTKRAMKTVASHALASIILLLAISSGALFFRLGSLPLSGPDEPRYARIAEEMREQGRWITPKLQGKPWLEKPPLYYWITVPFLSLFKTIETAARVGPALCALITALVVFFLGSVLWSRLAGLLGASILLTSMGFIGFGRSASTDMPFACCFTLAMAILAAAVKKDPGAGKIMVAYVFLGLAILGKGPVAILLAAGIGFCFWLLDESGSIRSRWRVWAGCAVMAAVSLPWFWLVFRQNGYSFISTFFLNHNVARYVTGIHHHSQPVYYFIPVLIALLFPWSGCLILLAKSSVKAFRSWREWDPCIIFLFCWALFPIIFFSFSDSKLAGYILPSFPPFALIMGARLSRLIDKSAGESRQMKISMYLSLGFSLAFAIAAPIYFQKEYESLRIGLLLAAASLAPSLIAFGFARRDKRNRFFEAILFQGLLVIIVSAQFAFPVLGAYHSSREIALKALEIQKAGEPMVTYLFSHHSLDYYTGYRIAGEFTDPGATHRFAQQYSSLLIVTTTEGLKTIPLIQGYSFATLMENGDLHLLRIMPK
jgi:4-amino-4-deoxy-L-arabinose transferase-like glycosyltransferase